MIGSAASNWERTRMPRRSIATESALRLESSRSFPLPQMEHTSPKLVFRKFYMARFLTLAQAVYLTIFPINNGGLSGSRAPEKATQSREEPDNTDVRRAKRFL